MAGESQACTSSSGFDKALSLRAVGPLALLFLGAVCALPLVTERGPVEFIPPYRSAIAGCGSKVLVLAIMCLMVGARFWADRLDGSWRVPLLLVALALLMAGWHWFRIDCNARRGEWQRELYLDILSHRPEESGGLRAPHQYRLLPYGFVRALERLTGDFWFACTAYRWFFTYWFLWSCYRFARVFFARRSALLTLVPVAALYPLSVEHYYGQLTDPLSHMLFALALLYIVEDRWIALTIALALGVLAKETAMIFVPAYFAGTWRHGLPALARTSVLSAACVAAYFWARMPLGWSPGYGSINGTEGLMIADNLGIGEPRSEAAVPIFFNYLHPLLFVGSFLPIILRHWRSIDGRLRELFIVLAPLLLFTNLCFGWMYESRNYMPLLPLQGTMVLQAVGRRDESLL